MTSPSKRQSVRAKSTKSETRSIGMRALIVIALFTCLLAMVLAAPTKGSDKFDPNIPKCGGHGVFRDGACDCYKHFHGDRCETYHSRRCTNDDQCGSAHAYCATKMLMQCRFSPHCKDPSGWCVPLDPAPSHHTEE